MAPHIRGDVGRGWGSQWLAGTGPGMTNHFEAGGFVRSNPLVDYPNLMIHFLPLAIRSTEPPPPGVTATSSTSDP